MKNGICPRCGSESIYKHVGGVGATMIGVHTSAMTMPSEFETYLCTQCGYYENYILDRKKLKEVERSWEKVPPQPPNFSFDS